jgi:hypothetical protein
MELEGGFLRVSVGRSRGRRRVSGGGPPVAWAVRGDDTHNHGLATGPETHVRRHVRDHVESGGGAGEATWRS